MYDERTNKKIDVKNIFSSSEVPTQKYDMIFMRIEGG
jgi:hypothetical protein